MVGAATEAWFPFAAAVAGAAAVLVGLIFVALSINLDALLRLPVLLRRAGAAIVLLLLIVVVNLLVLVPGQPARLLAVELLLVAATSAWVITDLLGRHLTDLEPSFRVHYRNALVWALIVHVGVAVCAISLLVGTGGGIYWLVPASLLGLCRSILESWVLLVEIKR